MKTAVLNRDDYLLLRQIIRSRDPRLLPLLESRSFSSLASDERMALRLAVEQEYAETGLDASRSPNNKGRILDELLAMIDLG